MGVFASPGFGAVPCGSRIVLFDESSQLLLEQSTWGCAQGVASLCCPPA